MNELQYVLPHCFCFTLDQVPVKSLAKMIQIPQLKEESKRKESVRGRTARMHKIMSWLEKVSRE